MTIERYKPGKDRFAIAEDNDANPPPRKFWVLRIYGKTMRTKDQPNGGQYFTCCERGSAGFLSREDAERHAVEHREQRDALERAEYALLVEGKNQ